MTSGTEQRKLAAIMFTMCAASSFQNERNSFLKP